MSWRFRTSFKVMPGLRLNLSRTGLSATGADRRTGCEEDNRLAKQSDFITRPEADSDYFQMNRI